VTVGVFPGTFDPLTVAHLAIGEATVEQARLARIDFVISRAALGKEDRDWSVWHRMSALRRAAATRPWMGAVATDAQLIADIAHGYDVVVMGADKWAQVRDAAWYGGDTDARDAAVASLPRVFVVPRPGFDSEGAEEVDLAEELTHVSSTRVRAGEVHLMAPEARTRLIVDGNNVIGSRPDGWWRDRAGAQRRFVAALAGYARTSGASVAVVLDGRPLPDLGEGVHDGVLVAYATRGGRNAADDRIVAEVERDREPASLTIVTSDRELERRVRALGAHVEHAGELIRALESAPR
jgi:predicted RNA-binding protein with PIN domain